MEWLKANRNALIIRLKAMLRALLDSGKLRPLTGEEFAGLTMVPIILWLVWLLIVTRTQ